MQQTFRGVGLATALEIPVQIESDAIVWVSVSQRSANYRVRVVDSTDQSLVKQVDLSAHKAVDDMVLIRPSECRDCLIYIEAEAKIDQHSPYPCGR